MQTWYGERFEYQRLEAKYEEGARGEGVEGRGGKRRALATNRLQHSRGYDVDLLDVLLAACRLTILTEATDCGPMFNVVRCDRCGRLLAEQLHETIVDSGL